MEKNISYGQYINSNHNEKELFYRKSLLIKNLRDELNQTGAIELYMPILHKFREGAPVHQFTTKHSLTSEKFYLRHCMEDHLRRLSYTYSQVFEIGKAFRVENVDDKRLNEFMVLEYVSINLSYLKGIEKFVKVLKSALKKTYKTLKINDIDFNEIEIITFEHLFNKTLNFTIEDHEFREKSAKVLKEFNVNIDGEMLEWEIYEELLKYILEPSIKEPTIIINFPRSLQHVTEIDKITKTAKRFSFIINGIEVSDGGEKLKTSQKYKEIYTNNAEYRRKKFHITDNELPNNFFNDIDFFKENVFTFGLGIDRLFSICENKTIKEVTLFHYE